MKLVERLKKAVLTVVNKDGMEPSENCIKLYQSITECMLHAAEQGQKTFETDLTFEAHRNKIVGVDALSSMVAIQIKTMAEADGLSCDIQKVAGRLILKLSWDK